MGEARLAGFLVSQLVRRLSLLLRAVSAPRCPHGDDWLTESASQESKQILFCLIHSIEKKAHFLTEQ